MSHRIGAAGPTVPPRGPLSAVPPRSSDSTCPPWCTTDHAAEMQRRREMAEHTAWSLAADGLFVEPVLDTYRMHSAEVGRIVVRAGQHERPAELLVLVQQCEDVDGTAGGSTGPLVSLHEPQWWSEDFTLNEAEQLAGLLRAARDLVAR